MPAHRWQELGWDVKETRAAESDSEHDSDDPDWLTAKQRAQRKWKKKAAKRRGCLPQDVGELDDSEIEQERMLDMMHNTFCQICYEGTCDHPRTRIRRPSEYADSDSD